MQSSDVSRICNLQVPAKDGGFRSHYKVFKLGTHFHKKNPSIWANNQEKITVVESSLVFLPQLRWLRYWEPGHQRASNQFPISDTLFDLQLLQSLLTNIDRWRRHQPRGKTATRLTSAKKGVWYSVCFVVPVVLFETTCCCWMPDEELYSRNKLNNALTKDHKRDNSRLQSHILTRSLKELSAELFKSCCKTSV